MRLATHIKVSPHGVFYFRVVIPARLRPMFHGRREIKKSLATRDPKLAKLWAYALSAQVGAKFEKARDAMKKGYDPSKFNPDDLSTWPGQEDAHPFEAEFHPNGALAKLKVDPTIPGDQENAMELVSKMQENSYLRQMQEQRQKQDQDERAVFAEAIDQSLAEKKGAVAEKSISVVETVPMAGVNYKPSLLSAAIALYRAEELSKKKKKTVVAYNRTLNWFSKFVGKDPFLHEIEDAMVGKWREDVLKPHFQKVAERKIASDISAGRLVVDPMVGPPKVQYEIRSVDAQITNLNAFFKKMQGRRHFPRNCPLPTEGQTLVSHAARKRLPGWKHFEIAELVKIFDPVNLQQLKKPHEFWMPLLGLFTGARINELAQLTHGDICQENNIWVIRISDEDYFQTLKNDASKRIIPLHPKLIELGFLDYLADARAAVPDVERIFPYLRYDESNGFADVPSEAFGRYLDKLQIGDRKKVFHTFRKNSNDRMKQNGAGEAERCQMVGHVYETTNGRIYANPYPVEYLLEKVVPKLDFPQINFAPLKYPPGRFRAMLSVEFAAAIKRKRKGKEESMQLHEESKAAREARAVKAKRGRPPKAQTGDTEATNG